MCHRRADGVGAASHALRELASARSDLTLAPAWIFTPRDHPQMR